MKTRNTILTVQMAAMLCIVAALISCSDGGGNNSPPPPPQEQPTERTTGTTKDLSFGTNCKVTIKGVAGEKYLNAEWTTLCDKVVAAIERGHNKMDTSVNQSYFNGVFALSISVILLKSATYDCEVKADETKIYLKTSVLDTIDLQPAVWAIGDGEAYHQP